MIWVDGSGELYPIAGEVGVQGKRERRAECPLCGERRVYFSGWRSFRELLARGQGMRPYRCHECGTRFLDRVGLSCYGMPGEVMLVPAAEESGKRKDKYVM